MSNTQDTTSELLTIDEVLDAFENDRRWDSVGEAVNPSSGLMDRDEAKAQLERIMASERLDEVKRSLDRGYFLPEMEVMAEGRIAELHTTAHPLPEASQPHPQA